MLGSLPGCGSDGNAKPNLTALIKRLHEVEIKCPPKKKRIERLRRHAFPNEKLNEITECDLLILAASKVLVTYDLVLWEAPSASVLPQQFYVLKPGLLPNYFVSDDQKFKTLLLAYG